ncbi:MAG: hypothetical protein AAGG08_15365 [Actinomycetota bacterium]
MRKILTIAAAGALVFSACGSDSGGSGDGSAAKDRLFNEMMAEFEGDTEGIDTECVRGIIDDIPDDQAVIIADNLEAEDIPDGVDESTVEAMTVGLFDCIDIGGLLESDE